tara:strand:+ start:579 stop:1823 length:1245 start_codon:yes stop_codon:yes gene_type:complete
MKNIFYISNALIVILIFFGCEDNETRSEDCAGIPGGDNVCGCTDSTATNFDSLATNDDGSCEFIVNGVPIKWKKTYIVSQNSEYDESWSVNKVSDGGFIIAGSSDYSGLLIKTDSSGNKEWHQKYSNSSVLYVARPTTDGGFIATGYYECDTLPGCYPDIYIVKTNSSGAKEWEIADGTTENNDYARDIIQTSDGNYVITGTWNDDGWNSKVMLRKYSNDGDLLWNNVFSSSTANEGNSIIETSNGDFIIAGYSGEQHGAYKHYMIKAGVTGEQIWKKKTQSIGDALLYSLLETPNGGYIAAGFCNSWRSNYIIERNSNGNIIWENCFIDSTSRYGYNDIIQAENGGYYLIDDVGYLTKITSNGDILLSIKLEDVNQSVIKCNNGDVVIGGYGFREGNTGGPISLLRLDPDSIE